jgi:hypothetical protein
VRLVITRRILWASTRGSASRTVSYKVSAYEQDNSMLWVREMPAEALEGLIPAVKGEWFRDFLEIMDWPEGFL